MKRDSNPFGIISRLILGLALWAAAAARVQACTIFVLTDTNRVLFCNNEDWSNPRTRIWFVPAGPNHYGAVYVGFDNDWAQGGLNTEGLAFDWVAGYKESWNPDPKLPQTRGNQQVLETCATVEQAIAFYREHREDFSYCKILLADRTGTSVIIGAKDGKLQVEKSSTCRGFGYGARTLDKLLARTPKPTVAEGARILRACLQKGQYATKYFNIFDLKTGDIFLFPFPEREEPVKFNLATELKKGGHYYDMPQIHEQLAQPLRPLLATMERCLLDKYQPIPDQEPNVTQRVRALLQGILDGTLRLDDFTDEAWKEVSPQLKQVQAEVKALGPLVSLTLVDRRVEDGKRSYRYRIKFEKSTLLQHLVFDQQNKVVSSRTEDIR